MICLCCYSSQKKRIIRPKGPNDILIIIDARLKNLLQETQSPLLTEREPGNTGLIVRRKRQSNPGGQDRLRHAANGADLITNLATIYALTGEKDLALKQLEIVSKLPYGPSYGELRLDPEWDSLRGDPRFEKIVASLAPKKR